MVQAIGIIDPWMQALEDYVGDVSEEMDEDHIGIENEELVPECGQAQWTEYLSQEWVGLSEVEVLIAEDVNKSTTFVD